MTSKLSHYLLFAEASRNRRTAQTWRFVLQNLTTERRFSAFDSEEEASSERLELLAVVRGLEALEGPARVTLVTKSRYVSRGVKLGLDEWRANNWRWERFGKIVTVRDADLWQRVDRALEFHQVKCQTWHFEEETRESTVASPEQLQESLTAESPFVPSEAGFPKTGYQSAPYHTVKRRKISYCPKVWRETPRTLGHVVGASA